MSETTCTRCQKRPPGIDGFIPFTGELKSRVSTEICTPCWGEWQEMQIKVINEFRLHMGEAAHRDVLYQHASQFFRFDGGDGSFSTAGPEGGLAIGGPSGE